MLESEGVDVINLAIGNPDLPPPGAAIECLNQTSLNLENHGYQSYQGIPELRDSIARFYLDHYQVSLNPESEVLPMMGSKEAIFHISKAFLNPGDQVLVPSLGYPSYTSVARLVGAQPVTYPLLTSSWEPDFDFLQGMDSSRVKIIWVNYPHMPTGARGSQKMFDLLIDWAREREVLICHDNPYSFILNEKPISVFSDRDCKDVAIELNSLSKTFNMAGWRVGWVAGSAPYLHRILQVKSNMDSGMFRPLQLAAVAALRSPKSWFQDLNDIYRKRRKLVLQIIDLLGGEVDTGQAGLFVWAKAYQDNEPFVETLLKEKGVFIAPGHIFGEQGRGFIRLSLCVKEESLNEAIRRLQ